jgi:hypothetical protein
LCVAALHSDFKWRACQKRIKNFEKRFFGHPSVRVRNAFGEVSMIVRRENDYKTGLLIEKASRDK